MTENIEKTEIPEEIITDWENPPKLADLKADLEGAQSAHNAHITDVDNWINNLEGNQVINAKKGRSKIVPKLIRKQAEWRYASLSDPYTSTDDLFNTSPVTAQDKKSAEQNGLVLNYQFNRQLDKVSFIDEYVRTAVDEGSVVVKVGWEEEEDEREVETPIFENKQFMNPDTGQVEVQQVQVDVEIENKLVTVKNQPTLEVCDYENVVIDPTCNGNLDKAEFVIYSFETSKSELRKDGRYKNIDNITFDTSSALSSPDHETNDESHFEFKDEPRKKFVVYEYWGFWDFDGSGIVKPFVATWAGDTLIRLEESPYPDKKLPFVLVQYLPVRKQVYGQPDGYLLEDNQRVIGAVTRGMIDIVGRSANGQQGIRKDALDVTNFRKFERGADFKFNANVDPKNAFHMEKFPEIPRSAMEILGLQNNEAESLTGVKAFSSGITGAALGDNVGGIRSAMDATAKRELNILNRLSNGINKIGRKIISMNQEFLADEEIIRITDDEFVVISRDDLAGDFDVTLDISTAESDAEKASELSFMLQTLGNTVDPMLSIMILTDIAKLRKMPVLAKRLEEYKPQPDPIEQQKGVLEIELLKAQIRNENAKGMENAVDVELKQAKTETERSKARNLHSKSDQQDLDFVEQESGTNRAHEAQMKELDSDIAVKGKMADAVISTKTQEN